MIIPHPAGDKLVGFYRGKVVKHLSRGKCKVYIPGINPTSAEFVPDTLPDAEQVTPLFGGSCNGNGVFSYPNLGSIVVCAFWNGDQNFPFFFASTLGGSQAERHYDEVRSDVTKENIESGQDAYIHKIDVNRSTIKIWESGYIEVITKSDDDATDCTRVVHDGKGNIVVDTTQQVQITAPNIKMTATSQMELNSPMIKVNAGTQLDLIAPVLCSQNGVGFNVAAPSINLDATSGAAVIKGKKHSAFFN